MLICDESVLWNICHGVEHSSNSSQLFSKSKLSIMRTKCTIMLFCLLKDIFFLSLKRYVFEEISNRIKSQERTHSKIFQRFKEGWFSAYTTSICIMGIEFLRPVIYYLINIWGWLPFISSTFPHTVSSENVKI